MKKQKYFFIEGFFTGFLFEGSIVWLLEENRKRKKRIELLEKELEDGFYLDKLNLDRDWCNIRADINNSYQKILEENSL